MSREAKVTRWHDPLGGVRAPEARTFALRAELRRSAYYVLAATSLVPALLWWLRDLLPNYQARIPALLLGCCLVPALGSFAVLRWRLKVDGSGISRRRLLRWDLWPWDAFQQGRVREAEDESDCYILHEKPFWARKLTLGLFDDGDREEVAGKIRGTWVRQARPPLPPELRLRYGLRRVAILAAGSLVVRNGGVAQRFRWNEVQSLRIRRREHDRRDFHSLELALPGQTITLRISHQHGHAIRSWSGADGSPTPTAQELAGLLERCVPPNRIQVTALSGPARTIAEWQDLRSLLERDGRNLTFLRRIIWIADAFLILIVLAELYRERTSGLKFLALCAIVWGLFWASLRVMERVHRKAVADLESQVPDPTASELARANRLAST
jgi:hypothetical protein